MHVKKVTQKDRYGNSVTMEYEVPQKPFDPTRVVEKAMDMKGDMIPEPMSPPVMGEEFNMGNPNNHPGQPMGEDTVPAWLTPGEFVVNAEATEMYGPQIEAMNDHGRQVQEMKRGGGVDYKGAGGLMKWIMPTAAKGVRDTAIGQAGEQFIEGAANYTNPWTAFLHQMRPKPAQASAFWGPGTPYPTQADYERAMQAKRMKQEQMFTENYNEGGEVSWREKLGFGKDQMELVKGFWKDPLNRIPSYEQYAPEVWTKFMPQQKNEGGMMEVPMMPEEALLRAREGYSDEVYEDTRGVPTVGWGHAVPDMEVGTVPFTQEQNDANFQDNIALAKRRAMENVGHDVWPTLDRHQQAALISQAYQLGGKGQAKFENMLDAVRAGDNERVIEEAYDSAWAQQTPKRVADIEAAFRNMGGEIPMPTPMIAAPLLYPPAYRYEGGEMYDEFEDVTATPINSNQTVVRAGDPRFGGTIAIDRGNRGIDTAEGPGWFEDYNIDYNAPAGAGYDAVEMGGIPDPNAPVRFAPIPGADGRGFPNIMDQHIQMAQYQNAPQEEIPTGAGTEPPVPYHPGIPGEAPTGVGTEPPVPYYPEVAEEEVVEEVARTDQGYRPATPQVAAENRKTDGYTEERERLDNNTLTQKLDRRAELITQGKGPGDHVYDANEETIAKLKDKISRGLERRAINDQVDADVNAQKEANKAAALRQQERDLNEAADRLEAQGDKEGADALREKAKEAGNEAASSEAPESAGTTTVTTDGTTVTDLITQTEGGDSTEIETNVTEETATNAASNATDEQKGQVEGMMKTIFGDLFDLPELKRMGIMYLGSRLMGYSHGGSLNWALKNYVKRVDAKVANRQAFAQQNADKFTGKSLDKFRETGKMEDLVPLGTPAEPFKLTDKEVFVTGGGVKQVYEQDGVPHVKVVKDGKTGYVPLDMLETSQYDKSIMGPKAVTERFEKNISSAVGNLNAGVKEEDDAYVSVDSRKLATIADKIFQKELRNTKSPIANTSALQEQLDEAMDMYLQDVKKAKEEGGEMPDPRSLEHYYTSLKVSQTAQISPSLILGTSRENEVKLNTKLINVSGGDRQKMKAAYANTAAAWNIVPQDEKDRFAKIGADNGQSGFVVFMNRVLNNDEGVRKYVEQVTQTQ